MLHHGSFQVVAAALSYHQAGHGPGCRQDQSDHSDDDHIDERRGGDGRVVRVLRRVIARRRVRREFCKREREGGMKNDAMLTGRLIVASDVAGNE